LRKPDAPFDPSNRRVSLIVHYLDTPEGKNQDLGAVGSALDSKAAAASTSPAKAK
jgi:hypothetical protein